MKSKNRLSDLKVMTPDQLEDEALKLKKEQFDLALPARAADSCRTPRMCASFAATSRT